MGLGSRVQGPKEWDRGWTGYKGQETSGLEAQAGNTRNSMSH